MKESENPLNVVIFNDASVAGLLTDDSPLWQNQKPAILAELGTAPMLAHHFNLETPPSFPGIAGLLGDAASPADLTVRPGGLSIPAILASSAPLSQATITAAVRRLGNDSRIKGPRVLLLEAGLTLEILPCLAAADQISIAWDLSYPPGSHLVTLLDSLKGEGLYRQETWGGLLGYFSPDHMATDEERRQAAESLGQLPSSRIL